MLLGVDRGLFQQVMEVLAYVLAAARRMLPCPAGLPEKSLELGVLLGERNSRADQEEAEIVP